MPRTVKEWIGRSDNTPPSASCKRRIRDRQDNRCALTGKPFRPGDKIQYDHKTPLWLGGENREQNLQAVLADPHKRKSAAEAAVKAKVQALNTKHFDGRPAPARKLQSRNTFPPRSRPRSTKQEAGPRRNLYTERNG